jgi:hypothetical protein
VRRACRLSPQRGAFERSSRICEANVRDLSSRSSGQDAITISASLAACELYLELPAQAVKRIAEHATRQRFERKALRITKGASTEGRTIHRATWFAQ